MASYYKTRACPECGAAKGKRCTVTVKGKAFQAKKEHAARAVKRGPATGPEPSRTPRIRFVEPPNKKDGNPFFALRVPEDLLDAFKAYARKKGKPATRIVREYMSKVTGVEASDADTEAA